jgi:protein TonB
MTWDRRRKSDFILIASAAFLINLLIMAVIPWLFRSGGVKRDLPALVKPPVYLVPAPVEEPVPQKKFRSEPEPETRLPEPVSPAPAPLPLPELNPLVKLSPVKIAPQIDTRLDLKALPPPAPVSAVKSSHSFYRVGELDRKPLGMARMQPPYPFRARRRGIEGKVKIRFYITPSGRVEGVRVVKAEPPGYFEKSVLDTVARWRFKPGMVGGRAGKTLVETTIVFKLDR